METEAELQSQKRVKKTQYIRIQDSRITSEEIRTAC